MAKQQQTNRNRLAGAAVSSRKIRYPAWMMVVKENQRSHKSARQRPGMLNYGSLMCCEESCTDMFAEICAHKAAYHARKGSVIFTHYGVAHRTILKETQKEFVSAKKTKLAERAKTERGGGR